MLRIFYRKTLNNREVSCGCGMIMKNKYHSLYVNPPIDQVPELTTIQLIEKFASEIGQAREYSRSGLRETLKERERLMEYLPKSIEELPKRRMQDSFVSAIIPLKNCLDIRDRYVTFKGNVRIGRVLEDMDVFSVFCAFKHILNPKSVGQRNPYSVVTALVDSIHVANDTMRNDEDVRLSGHVTYAGKSSLEVSVLVDQKDEAGVYQKIFESVFLMVARDPMNNGPALINPLVAIETDEISFLEKGKERQRIRKAQELDSLKRKPPTEEERQIIHDMFIEEQLTQTGKNMKDSQIRTLFICHPQYRNRYNKIFGGFIMRQAYELAMTNCHIYAKRKPRIVNIDDIIFRRPVEIGSILRYTSAIGYVEGNYIHCPVRAEVIKPQTGECELTNVFQFTFRVDDKIDKITGLPFQPPSTLTFQTYKEAMVYLESRRHFRKMMDQFGLKLQKAEEDKK